MNRETSNNDINKLKVVWFTPPAPSPFSAAVATIWT